MNDEIRRTDVSSNEEPSINDSSSIKALATWGAPELNLEAKELLTQIIAETDLDKTKDLTYLFNVNQNKKTLVRIDKLSGLQDNLVNQFVKRINERPDEISNKELMDGLKIVQDIIERGQRQVSETEPAPLIQVNQQTNSVNIGNKAEGLNREARERVKNAVLGLLSGLTGSKSQEPIVLNSEEVIEDLEETDEDENL